MTRNELAYVICLAVCCAGCFIFPRPDPEDPVPAPDYEGCNNDHARFYEAADDVTIWADSGQADTECNELLFHSGSAAQGPTVFHVEPVLRFEDVSSLGNSASVTWEVYSLEDPDDPQLLQSQGFEIWDDELEAQSNGVSHRSQVFIGVDERGKNLLLRAYVHRSDASLTKLAAAVYLSGSP